MTEAEAAARAGLITVESYAVYLDLAGDGQSARSRTEVRFSCRVTGATTHADLDAVAVHAVTLNGKALDPGSVTAGRLPLSDLTRDNTLTVDATVSIAAAGRGLCGYVDPADGQRYVLAQCFPTAAPSVFCCFDQPDLRASLSLIVSLPAGWTCVANGEPSYRPADGVAGVWRFAPVPAMKPYEFTLCAGPYVATQTGTAADAVPAEPTEHDSRGPALAVYCRASLAGSPGLTEIASIVAAAVRYYEQLLGVACPYPKLDIVFAPELGPAAMQLPGVMYVRETLLQRAADRGDDFVPVVLAHEAAHLWFGCLAEGRWWDDLWLAEALASYLSYAAAAAVLGQPDAWAEFGLTGQASAYQADSLPSTQPVSSPVRTAADALTRPAAITYSKGTSVIRQLEAQLGTEALAAGLNDYLTRRAWSATSLSDLIDCWSRAGQRDLSAWAAQWLQQPGVNELRPDVTVDPGGVITSLAIAQTQPRTGLAGPLRTHRLTVGFYEADGARLTCTRRVAVTARGDWTHVPELTGSHAPAAVILNDADLTFATVRFDEASWTALVTAAMDVSDPRAESVCWNAAFDMVQFAELAAAELAALVARRIIAGGPAVGLDQLLDRALAAVDRFADPASRSAGRQHLAAAVLSAAEQAAPAGRAQHLLARAFASSADSEGQLDLLRAWLAGRSRPPGLAVDHELHARILAGLAARDLVSNDDLAAYAAADPVSGDTVAATCAARRPELAAKQAAWEAALATGQSPRLALAHAQGFWMPGQEELTEAYRDRYFTEALPAIRGPDARTAQRLATALYPATLADEPTLAATDHALASSDEADPLRPVLVEQRELLRRAIAARRARWEPAW